MSASVIGMGEDKYRRFSGCNVLSKPTVLGQLDVAALRDVVRSVDGRHREQADRVAAQLHRVAEGHAHVLLDLMSS